MLQVGIHGIGFMGMMHYLAYQKCRGVKVAAICSRDAKKRSGDWRGIQGNFGPPGQVMELGKIQSYATLEEMLANPALDVIDVCLPPAQHAAAAVQAFQAGKHVFCEKPIALTPADAKRMTAASERSGKRLFVGHVLPYFPAFAYIVKVAQSGKFGKLLGGHFKRVIGMVPDPQGYFDPHVSGGPLIDLHVHDAHLIRVLFGMPEAVFSTGRCWQETPEYACTHFLFRDQEFSVSAISGVLRQTGRSFNHAYEIHFEQATLVFDWAVLKNESKTVIPLTVLGKGGQVMEPELPAADDLSGFVGEITEFTRCIKKDEPSSLLDGGLARDALELCHAQAKSLRSNKLVKLKSS